MPPITLARMAFGLLSLLLLGVGAYLLWDWWRGEWGRDPLGVWLRLRDDWKLWVGLAILAWSFLGRLPVLAVLTRADVDPTSAVRGAGERLAGADGDSLYVERWGPSDAPTVVLIHGWGMDSTIWDYARRDLSPNLRVVCWDLPGLGRSRLNGPVSLARMAENLRRVIETCEPGPVILVGHSIGGMIIQTLARDHPAEFRGRVAGVVLANTTYVNPLETMVAPGLAKALRWPVLEPLMRLAAWLEPLTRLIAWQSYLSGSAHLAQRLGFGRWVTRSQLEHATRLATRNPPAVLARGNLAMFRWEAGEGSRVEGRPLLVMAGDRDIVTRAEAGNHIARTAAQGRLIVVDGANHMGFLERREIYNRLILEFIQGLTAPVSAPLPDRSPADHRDRDPGGMRARRRPETPPPA